MKKTALVTLALLVPTLMLQGGGEHAKMAAVTKAVCVLSPKSKSKVRGVLWFTQRGHSVEIKGKITGLTPGKHGFHVHEFGDITDAKGLSTGGHYDPKHVKKHGKPDDKARHVGDLGNITADESGTAMIDITDSVISLNGPHAVIGRSIIVHEKEDVFTQPVGNAGGRVAAGVIGIASAKMAKK